MGDHPQKFVDDAPSQIPRRVTTPPVLQSSPARLVLRGVSVGGVHQNVGIDNKHLGVFLHHGVERLAIRDVHQIAAAPKHRELRQILDGGSIV